MGGHAAEDEGRQERERHDEGVEEAVVALADAVAHPGAVVVEALWQGERAQVRGHKSELHNARDKSAINIVFTLGIEPFL